MFCDLCDFINIQSTYMLQYFKCFLTKLMYLGDQGYKKYVAIRNFMKFVCTLIILLLYVLVYLDEQLNKRFQSELPK